EGKGHRDNDQRQAKENLPPRGLLGALTASCLARALAIPCFFGCPLRGGLVIGRGPIRRLVFRPLPFPGLKNRYSRSANRTPRPLSGFLRPDLERLAACAAAKGNGTHHDIIERKPTDKSGKADPRKPIRTASMRSLQTTPADVFHKATMSP